MSPPPPFPANLIIDILADKKRENGDAGEEADISKNKSDI